MGCNMGKVKNIEGGSMFILLHGTVDLLENKSIIPSGRVRRIRQISLVSRKYTLMVLLVYITEKSFCLVPQLCELLIQSTLVIADNFAGTSFCVRNRENP